MNSNNLKNKAFSGMIWKFMERICAQVVSLIVSIVLARILMPDDYSIVSIVTIFFTFCNVFISGGLNTALIQKKDADVEDYSTVLHTSMFVALILYMVMFFLAPSIANLYSKQILIPVIRIMSLTFFINAFKSVLSAYTSSNLQFKKFFFSTIVGTIISAFVGIYMAINGYGAWALVAQQMTNSLLDTLILYLTTKYRIIFKVSFKKLKSLFSYGWKIFVSSIISVIYDQINPLIVGVKYTSKDLAYYSKGQSYPGLINSTISDTLQSVLFPIMSKVQDNKEMVLSVTRKYIKVASYVIFPMMIGLFSVSDIFVEVVLTEKWLPIVPYIQIFCFSYMLNIIQVGNLQAIKAIGRSDITLILEIVKKSFYLIIIILFVILSKNPIVLALSSIVCTVFATVVNTYPNRKLLGYKYKYQLNDLLPNLIISIIMGIVVYLIKYIQISKVLILILQVFIGIIVYLLLSKFTKNENLYYLIDYVRSYFRKRDAK